MPTPNPAAFEFLTTRRSRPAKTLTSPVPTRDQLIPILEAAARTPDHGKLEPWRFIVLEKPALMRLAQLAADRGHAMGIEPDKRDKGVAQYANADLAVAVRHLAQGQPENPADRTGLFGGCCMSGPLERGAGQWLGRQLAVRLGEP